MSTTLPPDDPAWADIRARYEAGSEKVTDIAASIGMSRIALSLYALKQGWKLRNRKKSSPRKATAQKATVGKAKAEATRQTIMRLKEMLQARVTQLENELKLIGGEVDALGNERGIKSLGLLVRTIEKVLDLERKDKLKRKQATREFKYFDDEQRRQLAAKIERLEAERDSGLAGTVPADGGGGGTEQSVALLGADGEPTAAGEG
jgi:uncharacterized protein (UPF0335 family)